MGVSSDQHRFGSHRVWINRRVRDNLGDSREPGRVCERAQLVSPLTFPHSIECDFETTRRRVSSVTPVPPIAKRALALIEREASAASSRTPELLAAGLLRVLRAHPAPPVRL